MWGAPNFARQWSMLVRWMRPARSSGTRYTLHEPFSSARWPDAAAVSMRTVDVVSADGLSARPRASEQRLGDEVTVSVVVPVYNASGDLRDCLRALRAAAGEHVEIIVVDDGSMDDPCGVASSMGIRCVRSTTNAGPAAARNDGARLARGGVLFFVDADVVISPDAISRVIACFRDRPDVAAVFGSYDASPRARSWISQYRNLLHHFMHQTASPDAQTFWTGCGAIRRAVFEAVGGFDDCAFGRGLEDVELGYRLRQAGYRILLDKGLQGTHLKRWTLRSMIATDVWLRAVPWTRLIMRDGRLPDLLNVKLDQRLSVLFTGLGEAGLLLSLARIEFLVFSVIAFLVVIGLNHRLFAFFVRHRGPLFAFVCVPLHLLYFTYSGLSFLAVWLYDRLGFERRLWVRPGRSEATGERQPSGGVPRRRMTVGRP
jgi:GT2 family glycosyltransferase